MESIFFRQEAVRRHHQGDLLCKSAFGVNFALIGIENQEVMDYAFPVWNMSYDDAEYEKQVAQIGKEVRKDPKGLSSGEYMYGFRKTDRVKPVITFVLYCGEEPWDGPTSLHEMIDVTDIPEQLKEMVQDYKVKLIEIRRLEDTEDIRLAAEDEETRKRFYREYGMKE